MDTILDDKAVDENMTAPDFMKGASCISATSYTDPDFFKKEMDKCFGKGWISIGTSQQVAEPGSILAVDVGDEPLLITRDKKGDIHVLYNICRHRGLKIVEGEEPQKCRSGLLSCPYHKWGYKLDGELMAAPYWNGGRGSAPADDMKETMGLFRVRSAVWCDIIFVNISGDAEDFETFINPLEDRWKNFDRSLLRQTTVSRYDVPANWKFACENFLDTYHVPWVHGQLGSANSLFPGLEFTYLNSDIFGFVMPNFDRGRDDFEVTPKVFPNIDEKFEYALDLIYVFPNTLLMITPSWFQIISVLPKNVGETKEILAGYLVGDEMLGDDWAEYREEFYKELNQVNVQDIEVLTKLQKGRKTDKSDEGHYAPVWDQLAEYMSQRIKSKVE